MDTPTRLAAGALAGITSVCTTYPLDLVRSRLSIATASIPLHVQQQKTAASAQPSLKSSLHTASATASAPGVWARKDLTVWGMTLKVMRDEGGVRALYRGMIPTAVGVAPYVGINFAAYEALRGVITPPEKNTILRKLACGALAGELLYDDLCTIVLTERVKGSISQTLTYPFDVLRRKMQVRGLGSMLGPQYNGALHAFQVIIKHEGIAGLYRGLWPNLRALISSIHSYPGC